MQSVRQSKLKYSIYDQAVRLRIYFTLYLGEVNTSGYFIIIIARCVYLSLFRDIKKRYR